MSQESTGGGVDRTFSLPGRALPSYYAYGQSSTPAAPSSNPLQSFGGASAPFIPNPLTQPTPIPNFSLQSNPLSSPPFQAQNNPFHPPTLSRVNSSLTASDSSFTDPLSGRQVNAPSLTTPRGSPTVQVLQQIPARPFSDPLTSASLPLGAGGSNPLNVNQVQIPITADPVEEFLRGAPSAISLEDFLSTSRTPSSVPRPPPRPQVDNMPLSLEAVKTLMHAGVWKGVLLLCDRSEASMLNHRPNERLRWRMSKILALARLRQFPAAIHELDTVGDLDSPIYLYSTYPDQYPGKTGSMVPFGLRFVHAILPHKVGNAQLSLDRLYILLGHCHTVIASLEVKVTEYSTRRAMEDLVSASFGKADPPQNPDGDPQAQLEKWRRREVRVTNSIINLHILMRDWLVAVPLLRQLLLRQPVSSHPVILSTIIRLQLQAGDVPSAEETLKRMECILPDPFTSPRFHIHSGCVAMAQGDFSTALSDFDSALGLDPQSVPAAVNKSICLLFLGRLASAVLALEDVLRADPVSNCKETLILNLCTLYDLAPGNAVEKKRTLQALVARYGPDDFDPAAFKLPTAAAP